jgi:prophage DNA circulation protein
MWRAKSNAEAAQQLVSLLRVCLRPAPPAGRPFASSAASPAKAQAFAKERKAHESSLSVLRKAWAAEHAERSAAAAAAAEAAAARRAAATAQRASRDAAAATANRRELLERQAEERAARADAKAGRLRRAELRADVLDVARQERCVCAVCFCALCRPPQRSA